MASKYNVETINTYNTSPSGADPSKRTTTTTQAKMVTTAEELRNATMAAANYTAQIDELNRKKDEGIVTEEEYNAQILELRKNQTEARNVAQEMYEVVSADAEAYRNAEAAEYDLSTAQEEQRDICEEALAVYDEFMEKLHGVTEEQEKLIESQEEIKEYSGEDIFNMKNADNTLNGLGQINEQLDNIQAAYKTLSDAMDTYNESGAITINQFQAIIAQGDDFLDYLVDEEGNLRMDEQAM